MDRVELVAILGSLTLLISVLELVRQKQLGAGYALLWLLTTLALLILSLWRDLLDVLAQLVGIFYPPAALFVIAFGFLLIILLQFSIVITRLSRENKKLAQQIALLSWKLRQIKSENTAKRQSNAERDTV